MSHDRIIAMYFFASLSFLVIGLGLSLVTQLALVPADFYRYYHGPPPVFHPYEDLGLRLFGIGIILVIATFYQSLVGEGKAFHRKNHPTESNTLGSPTER